MMKKVAIGLAMAAAALAADSPYKVIKTIKIGGEGGYDYVYADSAGRRLYVPRPGQSNAHISVFDLDSLAPVGDIANTNARGVAVDPKSHHGFASSKPVLMFDSSNLTTLKTIPVEGGPDGILFDPFNSRVWVFSHRAPNATVIDSGSGAILGTLDLGGAPEQAVTDGKGHLYVDLEDKDKIAVVDSAALKVTGQYDLAGKGGGPGGLAFDVKNGILFAACHEPATMVILRAADGQILSTLPIGKGVDGAGFDTDTAEAFSSQGDGTLTLIKENSPTEFQVEQTVQTMPGARTSTLDTKTNHILLIGAEFGPAAPGARRGPMVPGSFTILEVGK